ncbi:PRTRC system protein B [Burkholderia sp. LS-044]|uniref:PRTRC system protein B n=1 Tax=Burkholderia TaxID=32008 RepID=UPI000F5A1FAB|nr:MULTISPECIES: PRTRC system protein B [Burkholderia]RQV14892.1 PRTRC system protein B [Burkholderia cenocepacia]THJ46729.1 PRTRC system protein B [Burkholderia sp. LS-044]
MPSISSGDSRSNVVLSHALLLYTNDHGATFATAHPVVMAGRDAKPVLGAGRPLDRAVLIEKLRQLAVNSAPRAEFLPATVLSVSADSLTWWCPPGLRRVFFKCREIGARSAVVPHPGLVFRATSDGFAVFAVQCSGRPAADTPIFEPPYFNTWDRGRICIGSAEVPRRVDVASIDGWEAGFFESAFTHPNAGGKRVDYKDGIYAFWRDMLDGKFGEAFPLKALVPTGWSVGEVACGIRREGA